MDTILLIEDNEELRDNTHEILMLSNYNVITARNGIEGLEMVKKNAGQISLVLCDIMMPELDGYGVLRACENIQEMKGVPFIFLTAKSERADMRKGMDLGADDYLVKPFSGDELLSVIHSRIKKSKDLLQNTKKVNTENNPFLNPETFTESKVLKNKFHLKKMAKRDTVFMEGEKSHYLYYLVQGRVKVYKTNEFGKEIITHIYNPGDFLGYNGLLDNSSHENSALTMEDSVVAMISRNDFLDLISENPSFYDNFIKQISLLLNESEEKLPKMAYYSARKKIADALVYASKKLCSGDGQIIFNISRDDLSAISGISPESVSRNLGDFKDEGLISIKNGALVIPDLKKLEKLKN